MKAIMIMFDSLNRRMLPPYGCDWVHAPNFERLAERSLRFDRAYIGSMPCMPARRELHTGRYNFLHRSWGPIEPFDDSMPQILSRNGIYSHLITDHPHYFSDGGATYHTRYSSWEFNRGQEGDPWKAHIEPDFPIPASTRRQEHNQPPRMWLQEHINRHYMPSAADQPQAHSFRQGVEFLQHNHSSDNWFLQIETFDPHEPFFTQPEFKQHYTGRYDGPPIDWPSYGPVDETEDLVQHIRHAYAALVSMCDHSLGLILDQMDALGLWEDTLLIVCTDHGFLLGEHDYWGKNIMPWYNEVAHIPLFIWDPRCGEQGQSRQSLVQMIDLPPTLLDYFGLEIPADMQGQPLAATLKTDQPLREAALFGAFGGYVNVTDGRFVYMRAPASEDAPLYEYTLMPTHIRSHFSPDELRSATLAPPFAFTKDCPVMKIAGRPWAKVPAGAHQLFDLVQDPRQQTALDDPALEATMLDHLTGLMHATDAPAEQFERLGIAQSVRAESPQEA